MSSEEGNGTGSDSEQPRRRRTGGKGSGGGGGESGSRDREDVEDLEADDEAAEEAQARLDEMAQNVEEDLEELVQDLDEVQVGGPPATESSGGAGESGATGSGTPRPMVENPPSAEDRDPPVGEWSDVPSASEFGREVLYDGALQDKHLEGEGEVPVDPPAEPSHENRYGSFDAFDHSSVGHWEDFRGNDGEGRGYTVRAKDGATVEDPEEVGAHYVYRTKFGEGGGRIDRDDLKTNMMACNSFCEAMGIETPRATYDAEKNEVILETVDENADSSAQTIKELTDRDRANKVDRQEFIDKLAVHGLAGNYDTSSDNIQIQSDGTVLVHDLDRAERRIAAIRPPASIADKAAESAEMLDAIRDDDRQLDIDAQDIGDRIMEIAYELEESGRAEKVVSIVEDQMAAMESDGVTDPDECTRHELLQGNIEESAQMAREKWGWE